MSEIEDLLRGHVESVDTALEGFGEDVSSIRELVTKLQTDVTRMGSASTGAVSRRGGPVALSDMNGDAARTVNSSFEAGRAGAHRLAISDADRTTMGAILRGTADSNMRIGSDPDGGYLVPDDVRSQIEALVLRQSPIRRVARVVDFQTGRTVLPINTRGTTAGWVGEGDDRVETETPELAALVPPGGTLYALPRASEELIDDAIVNLEQFIEENVVDALAEKESQAFIRGDGIKKPKGFLMNDITAEADDVRPLGALQSIASGAAGTIGTKFAEVLVKMIFSMKSGYRQAPGTAWLASTDLIAKAASLHDGDGRPLYAPSLAEGVPGTLLGYPVIEAEHMDPVAAGNFPLAFGNWQRGYVIGDRTQLNVLRDPYTTKGQVKWYFRKRVHGSTLNSEAIKLLKVGLD